MPSSDRKRREKEQLRQRVLDAAEEIITRDGIKHVTMRRIAAKVDYAQTVLYRLFANKDDLIDHLIARGYRGVRKGYEEALQQRDADPMGALVAVLQAYGDYALAHPNHYRMWFDTSAIRLERDQLKIRHGRQEYVVFQVWLDCIDACLAAGFFRGRSRMDLFQIIWARVHGLISLRLQHPDFTWLPLADQLSDSVTYL